MIHINELQEYNLTSGQMNLLFRMRIIWRDIATWIRFYLVSVYENSDSELKQNIINKLYNVPTEYVTVLRMFFGDMIAEEYARLLSNYIKILIDLIDAQKSENTEAVSEYAKQLYQNTDESVDFLTQTNPFWQKEILRSLFYSFNDMTIKQANSYSSQDFSGNINLFERILNYSTVIGDYLAKGLLNYFTYTPTRR